MKITFKKPEFGLYWLLVFGVGSNYVYVNFYSIMLSLLSQGKDILN